MSANSTKSSRRNGSFFDAIVKTFYNVYCYFTFTNAYALLERGKSENLTETTAREFYPKGCEPNKLLKKFNAIYNELKGKKAGRIDTIPALLRQEWKGFAEFIGWIMAESVIRLGTPYILREFLRWIEDYRENKADAAEGWKWGMLLSLSPFAYVLIHHRMFLIGTVNGYRMRISLTAAVHAKILKLNAASIARTSSGHIINLMSTDLRKLELGALYTMFAPLAPMEAAVVVVMVSFALGILPAIAGMSSLILIIPIQSVLAKYIAKWRSQIARITDKRVELTEELISGNLAVKMLGWEDPLVADVNAIREREHQLLLVKNMVVGIKAALPNVCHVLVVCTTFITYRFTSESMNMPDVFFALNLMALPTISLSFLFLNAVESISECYVACKRADALLKIPDAFDFVDDSEGRRRGQVEIRNGTFGCYVNNDHEATDTAQSSPTDLWSKVSSDKGFAKDVAEPELRQILSGVDFCADTGELIGVAGRVGSGKSSLLSALLNDLVDLTDANNAAMTGTVAYCQQIPWIMAGTVRENILFGTRFDERLYHQVITSCAFDEDLEQFPNGDETEIGERGINLSGGQKTRLALARAAYRQADIYLLDDPLSAVDPKVGRTLFDRCIGPRGLLKTKTRVLVTHQSQFLPLCDRVIVMDNGRITAIGTWNEVRHLHLHNSARQQELDQQNSHHYSNPSSSSKEKESLERESALTSSVLEDSSNRTNRGHSGDTSEDGGKLVEEETKEEGKVAFGVYFAYAKLIGLIPFSLTIALMAASVAALYLTDWWVATWASAADNDQDDYIWVWVLIGLTVSSALSHLVSVLATIGLFMTGSTKLHRQMLHRVMHAPLRFFHTNPTGRILNRFSKDVGLQDEQLPPDVADFATNVFMLLGAFALVMIALPYMVILLLILVWISRYYVLQFLIGSREMKRFESITTSPVYGMITANIRGLPTIRAFKIGALFQQRFLEAMDLNGSWWMAFVLTSRWLAFRLDGINALVMLFSAIFAIVLARDLPPEVLGLALTQIIGISNVLQWTLRQTAALENAMTAVERNIEYTSLEQEPPRAVDGGGHAPQGWPCNGEIVYDSVVASYRPGLEPVLKNLSFVIPGGCSVGVVGRTGAGKSSLLMTLFRLIDINEGTIRIDGIDTSSLGIDVIRKPLAVIPQDPVLFGGTVRSNMDPSNSQSDSKIWYILKQVCLDSVVAEIGGLDAKIAESGSNFSVGQRQLLCLARALLAEAKILALDEATANVDQATDRLIQKSIDTIRDCDRILVLSDGQMVEYGQPTELIAKNGVFAEMVAIAEKATVLK